MPIELEDIVHSDPEILGGTPVFVGTRVPVQTLLDYLRGGDTLEDFLLDFPSVRRDQAESALDMPREALTAVAAPSSRVRSATPRARSRDPP